jgi:hypothetical protein
MGTKIRLYTCVILTGVIWYGSSCVFACGAETKKDGYSIPYQAVGDHQDIYKNLVDSRLDDPEVKALVSRAKMIAKEAGYTISGEELNSYTFENKQYPLSIKVYENSDYYLIIFVPVGVPITSQDLKISIQKRTGEVVMIFRGS